MRILSGSLKGLALTMPKGNLLRPTTGNVREAVFNVLGQSLDNLDFIDLCCGTGAMGLEAISRGATSVIFVEYNRKVAKALRSNVRSALDRLNNNQIDIKISEESFDVFLSRGYNARLVYFDPPYDFFYSKEWASKPYSNAVKSGGYFIMEHPKREPRQVPEKLDGMNLIQTRKYGKSSISIFQA